ncbi:MAG: GNAT family N-acetyltransferase [Propionibacteriaceae bacterium]|nr:GNAT family N-acetyltransferase [Propionibacteriaceae bacterium]
MNSIADKAWSDLTRDEFFGIVRLRTEVFYLEQRITAPDFGEADRDERTRHLWIADPRGCAAYLRVVCLDGPQHGARRSFGRVAVRADRRGEGLARRLVARVLADYGDEILLIHSQQYVAGLYREFGFEAVGEPFDEAGLPHVTMVRPALGAQCHQGISR